MNKCILLLMSIIYFTFISNNIPQSFKDFYAGGFSMYIVYSHINNSSKGYNTPIRPVTYSYEKKLESSLGFFSGIGFEGDFSGDETLDWHMEIKSRMILGDFWYLIGSIADKNDEEQKLEATLPEKVAKNYISTALDWRNGLNIYTSEFLNISTGGVLSMIVIETYNDDGTPYPRDGSFFTIGPYIKGDFLLTDWAMGRIETAFFIPFANALTSLKITKEKQKEASQPSFIEISPVLFFSSGLYIAADILLANGLADASSDKDTGYNFKLTGKTYSMSRIDFKLGYRFMY